LKLSYALPTDLEWSQYGFWSAWKTMAASPAPGPRHSGEKTDTYRVSALIANRTRPSLACRVEIVEIDGLPVLVVEVPTSRTPVSTPEGKYQRRAIGGNGKPECMPYLFPEMLARQADRGIQDYSALVVPDARREDLANALIHRDYSRLGAVHVQWHEDRIEISNPGGFPEGVRLDNLLVMPPRARSPVLADAFKRAGIVERTARGIDAIFFEQLRNGRQAPFL
jgi:predicted HTH transcriptional regulator